MIRVSAVWILLLAFPVFAQVREPAVAGKFYPAERTELSQTIDAFLAKAPDKQVEGELIALIVPHAGYEYSGRVAAYGYKQLLGREFDTVVVMGPSHRIAFDGISIGKYDSFRTPLGSIPADTGLIRKLLNYDKRFIFSDAAHQKEHSTEVQLPFLQKALNKFKLVEIIIGNPSADNCQLLAAALLELTAGKKVLFIASSDLSHYYSYDKAVIMDQLTLAALEKNSVEMLANALAVGRSELCGLGPVLTVIMIAGRRGVNRIKILDYANSGDVTGDKDRVVGYAAVGYYQRKTMLNETQKKRLLGIARKTLESYLKDRKKPKFEEKDEVISTPLGVFVTLTKQGRLRGCIGFIRPVKPLYEAVSEMAIAAATEDNRFESVTYAELKDLVIEISVLSPFEPVPEVKQIEVGKHGLLIQKGYHSGLLLPQVPGEYGWNREQFLENLCYKAGLPSDAWKDKDSKLFSFTADVFSEK